MGCIVKERHCEGKGIVREREACVLTGPVRGVCTKKQTTHK